MLSFQDQHGMTIRYHPFLVVHKGCHFIQKSSLNKFEINVQFFRCVESSRLMEVEFISYPPMFSSIFKAMWLGLWLCGLLSSEYIKQALLKVPDIRISKYQAVN